MSKARLKLVIANLVVSGMTFRTCATSADKRYGNPVTHAPFGNALAHGLYYARQFMTRNMGQFDIRIMSLPAVPVTQADSAGHDLQHDTITTGYWVRQLFYFRLR